jgi:hypothetical protein
MGTGTTARLAAPFLRPLRVLLLLAMLLLIPTSLIRGRHNRRSSHPDGEAYAARPGDVRGTGDARIEAVNSTQDPDRLRGIVRPMTRESAESSRHPGEFEVRYRWKR